MANYSTILGPRGEKIQLNGKAQSSHYRASGSPGWGWDWGWDYSKRPQFSLMIISLMRFDPIVSFGLRVRKSPVLSALSTVEDLEEDIMGESSPGKVERTGFMVESDNPEVANFIADQIHHIGLIAGAKLMQFMDWGFCGYEVTYKEVDGKIQVDDILDFAPWDIRPLVSNREVVGVSVPGDELRLFGMKSLWLIHDRQYTNWFGTSQLRYAYDPWHDKWTEGGAVDVRRLWAHKDVYGGDIIWYPDKIYNYADGDKHARDIAREQVERRRTGGVMGFPSTRDQTGNKEWEYDRPQHFINGSDILQYPKELDTEILRGLFIPDDLIQSTVDGSTGTYGGRKVTVEAFHNVCQQEWNDLLFALNDQIIKSLVQINFGSEASYQLRPRPIVSLEEEEQQQGMGMGMGDPMGGMGGPMGSPDLGGSSAGGLGPPSGPTGSKPGPKYISKSPKPGGGYKYRYANQMSLAEEMVANGLVGATELVDHVHKQLFERDKSASNSFNMGNAAHAPKGGVTLEGQYFPGGQFIPGYTQEEVNAAAASQGASGQEQPARSDQADKLETQKDPNQIEVKEDQFKDIDDPQSILDILSTISEYDPELADFGLQVKFQGANFPEGTKYNAIAKPKENVIYLPNGKTPDGATIAHELEHLRQYAKGQFPGRDELSPDQISQLERESRGARKKFDKHATQKEKSGRVGYIPYHKGNLPEHLKGIKIAPGWKDVWVSTDPNAGLLVVGKDSKGRRVSVYSKDHHNRNGEVKFKKIQELQKDYSTLKRKNTLNIKAGREEAIIMSLIMSTGMRPGSNKDTKARKKAYGATTLLGQHVKVDGNRVVLEYVGKSGKDRRVEIKDPDMKKALIQKKSQAGNDSPIFNTSAAKLRSYANKLTGGRYTPKDMRTRKATYLASQEVINQQPPKSEKEYRKMVKEVAAKVSKALGNTPTVALQSYIDPTVFAKWQTYKLQAGA